MRIAVSVLGKADGPVNKRLILICQARYTLTAPSPSCHGDKLKVIK